MTPDELQRLKNRYPISETVARLNTDGAGPDHSPAPPPQPQRAAQDPPAPTDDTQEGGSGRFLVRVTDYRSRLCDEDNLVAKFHIDALRYMGCLPSDAPGLCKISVDQKKVPAGQERVQIQIYPPGTWQEEATTN